MTRRAPLAVVGEPALISSGLAPDRHAVLQPLWETAENVRFYQGKVRRLIPAALMAGGLPLIPPDYKIRGIHQQQNSNGVRWAFYAGFAGGNIAVWHWYGPAVALVTIETMGFQNDSLTQKATQVDFTQWGDWTLWTYGDILVVPRWYRPGIGVNVLPNAPACIQLMKKQNQLIAIGTGLGRRGVAWSHADNIELWAAAADNLAGSLTIEELKTPIRGAARLGQNIACYTEDQMALVYWVGQPFIFGQRVALDGIGVTGKQAVCSDGRLNYGVSRNGCWQTDGSDFRYIDHGILSDYLQANVNWDQSGKIVVFRNDVTRCIEFHFPIGANLENSEAWSFDPTTGGWGRVPAYQAGMERVLFDKPLVGKDGAIYMLDEDPAIAAALNLVTKPMFIDQPEYPGFHVDARIDEIEFALKAASNIEFRLENAVDIDGPWEVTPWQTLSADLRTYRQPALPTGTFHRLAFRSTANNWDLDLQGFTFYGFVEGTKRDVI